MIISVASGKGGTGKTLVSSSIAKAYGVCQFFDYDVEAPNADIFLKPDIKNIQDVTIKQPYFITNSKYTFEKCAEFCQYNAVAAVKEDVIFFEELCHGCGGCILVGPVQAVREKDVSVGVVKKGFTPPGIFFASGDLKPGSLRGVTIQNVLEKLIEKDNLAIIDCPPGNSCNMVTAVRGSDFCILVTEPTPYGVSDLKISVEILRNLGISFAVIVNKFGIGNDEIFDYCSSQSIKILEKIPHDIEIARSYSRGDTLLEFDSSWKARFNKVIDEIRKEVSAK